MWAIFKLSLRIATILFLLSALASTITSAINPAIPIIKAGTDIAELIEFEAVAASITIPIEILFYGSLAFATLMLLWKKGYSNGTKALSINKKLKQKFEDFERDWNEKEKIAVTQVDGHFIKYLSTVNDEGINIRTRSLSAFQELCLSLPQITSAPTNKAESLNKQKKWLINKFTALAVQMRAGNTIDMGDAITKILDDPYFNFSVENKTEILNSIQLSSYFQLLNEAIHPTSYWKKMTNYISNKIFNLSTILAIPGEICLSAFGLLLPLFKISGLDKRISLAISFSAGFFASFMTAALLYNTAQVRENVALNNAFKKNSSFFKRLAIVYGGVSSGLGSATIDLVITNAAIAALYGEDYKEYNFVQNISILAMYIMLIAIAYRKILGTIDQMEETFNQSPNLFYNPPIKRNLLENLRDFSVPVEKSISASLATLVQVFNMAGAYLAKFNSVLPYITSLGFAGNTLICTGPQAIAVLQRAADQQQPETLIANEIFSTALDKTYEQLIAKNTPHKLKKKEQQKFRAKFDKTLALEISNSKTSVAPAFNFSFFNTPLKQEGQPTITLDNKNLSINSSSPYLPV